jgi:hypothetical protein
VVVCHENLCADPSHELDRLFKKLKLVASVNDFVDRLKAPQPASTELLDLFDPTLIDESICLYKRFNNSGGVSEHV